MDRDLAFYFAQKHPVVAKKRRVAYYCIENSSPIHRLSSSFNDILKIYNETLKINELKSYRKIFYSTSDSSFVDIANKLKKEFSYEVVCDAAPILCFHYKIRFYYYRKTSSCYYRQLLWNSFLYLKTTSKSYDFRSYFFTFKEGYNCKQIVC